MSKKLTFFMAFVAFAVIGLAMYVNPYLTCLDEACMYGGGYYLTNIGNGYHPYAGLLAIGGIGLLFRLAFEIERISRYINYPVTWVGGFALVLSISSAVLGFRVSLGVENKPIIYTTKPFTTAFIVDSGKPHVSMETLCSDKVISPTVLQPKTSGWSYTGEQVRGFGKAIYVVDNTTRHFMSKEPMIIAMADGSTRIVKFSVDIQVKPEDSCKYLYGSGVKPASETGVPIYFARQPESLIATDGPFVLAGIIRRVYGANTAKGFDTKRQFLVGVITDEYTTHLAKFGVTVVSLFVEDKEYSHGND